MKNLKRIGLYGISGTGKTTILQEVVKTEAKVIWLEGSQLVLDSAGLSLEEFKKIPEHDKYSYREKAIEKAMTIQRRENKHLIIDGHLVFVKGEKEFENVMTQRDEAFYTDYIYLKLPAVAIYERLQKDKIRQRKYSMATLDNWMKFELKTLSDFCEERQLKLCILETLDLKKSVNFICNYLEKIDA